METWGILKNQKSKWYLNKIKINSIYKTKINGAWKISLFI
jgi:hypothetical protein